MPERLRLALIADIHYGADETTKKGSAGARLLEHALERMSEFSPDLLVDLGDRINDENEAADEHHLRELGTLFRATTVPRVHLLGNHDVKHLALAASEQILESPLRHRTLELQGWRLIFWCADVTYQRGVGGLTLTQADIEWLEGQLASPVHLPTVIFTHVPLDGGSMVGNYYFERNPAGRAGYHNAHVARSLIERNGRVVMAVAGHVHWNSLNIIDGVHYVTLQSLTEAFTTYPAPAAAWAELELTDRIDWKVHGRDPVQFQLPLKPPDSHWMAYGGKGNPVSRNDLAKEALARD